MQTIDKHQQGRIDLFRQYIDQKIYGDHCLHYKQLDNHDRRWIKNFLSADQQGFCAYCMRQVPNGNVDHVIPQSVKDQQNFMRALHLGNGSFFPQFIGQHRFVIAPQRMLHPHTLAYGNMVYACKSCNTRKDADVIVPNFFFSPTGISYQTNGSVHFPKNALSIDLRAYLQSDIFCLFRALWNGAVQNNYTCDALSQMTKKSDRKTFIEAMQNVLPVNMQEKLRSKHNYFVADNGWKMFLSYHWFEDYYRQMALAQNAASTP